jgi:hypothetical protein
MAANLVESLQPSMALHIRPPQSNEQVVASVLTQGRKRG